MTNKNCFTAATADAGAGASTDVGDGAGAGTGVDILPFQYFKYWLESIWRKCVFSGHKVCFPSLCQSRRRRWRKIKKKLIFEHCNPILTTWVG